MHEIRLALKETYNRISSRFAATRKQPWEEVERFIKDQPEAALILDLASGTGRHSIAAKRHRLTPIAGDFSIGQLRELKKTDPLIPSVMLDLTALPFRNAAFDSIICIAAIHHLDSEKKRMESLKEAHRTLKPGSSMLTAVWALDQPRFIGKAKDGDIHYTWDKTHPRFYHLFRDEELKRLAEKTGLDVISSYRKKDNIYLISRAKNRMIGTRIR